MLPNFDQLPGQGKVIFRVVAESLDGVAVGLFVEGVAFFDAGDQVLGVDFADEVLAGFD